MFKTTFQLSFLALTLLIVSCKKQEENPGGNSPIPAALAQDTITSFMVYFENTSDSSSETGSYDDPDGAGPKQPNVGGVSLKANNTYKVSFRIEDGSNPATPVMIHNKIKTNGKDFKICLDNPLGITVTAIDSDGSMPIGLINTLNTSSTTGDVDLGFTIKYQKGVKTGDCNPGQVYYTCKIPVSVY